VRAYNFGASGNIHTKRFQATCRDAGVITWVQFLEGPPSKIWECEKRVQNSARFLTTFEFDREYLRNGLTYRTSGKNPINHNPFHVGRKKLVNIGPQTKMFEVLLLTHPTGHFPENYISALAGAAPSKFYTRYRFTTACYSARPTANGVPQKIVGLIVKI